MNKQLNDSIKTTIAEDDSRTSIEISIKYNRIGNTALKQKRIKL